MDTTYARFYKCDFQLQTPEDGTRWAADDPVRLASGETDASVRAKADRYLRRCHEVGLEAVAVTDHNLSPNPDINRWFLSYLLEENKKVASEVGKAPLIIFPGFELDIGYHVLCLFEPGTSLQRVSDCLTQLGLSPEQRFQGGQPMPARHDGRPVALATVLNVVQEKYGGLLIAAHAFSSDGIAHEGRDAQDYRTEDLLALEVPRVPLPERAQAIIEQNVSPWTRRRPPAYIMSSDCKRLEPRPGDEKNFIGGRFTWIKMSSPSIESLRQAFLDQSFATKEGGSKNSRIRFGSGRPEDSMTFPRIRAIRVSGASFLRNVSLDLSPNLNVLIGGRGAGKSTLIEYLRLAVGQESAIHGHSQQTNLQRLKGTLGSEAAVEVDLEKNARVWTLRYSGDGDLEQAGEEEIPDLQRFFPVRVFSQGEIAEIADDRRAYGSILDDMIRDKLDKFHEEASTHQQKAAALEARLAEIPKVIERKSRIRTEVLDLRGKLDLLGELKDPLSTWRRLLNEHKRLEELKEAYSAELGDLQSAVESVAAGTVEFLAPATQPRDDVVVYVSSRMAQLRASLQAVMLQALEEYQQRVEQLFHSQSVEEWRRTYEAEARNYEVLRQRLERQGADPDSYLSYERSLADAERRLEEAEAELAVLAKAEEQRTEVLHNLRAVWRSEANERAIIARDLETFIPKTAQGSPFVRVSVHPFGDERDFSKQVDAVVRRDRRRLSDEDWGVFNEAERSIEPTTSLLAQVLTATSEEQSPIDTLIKWVKSLRVAARPDNFPWPLDDRRTRAFLDTMTVEAEHTLERTRVADRVRIELYREDGSLAGELEQGLSAGQRNTAILAVLLAKGSDPMIVDQPESELDNEFVFKHLVPLLRETKESRQLLVATHNANIPVNGDAELIVALEARGGHGRIWKKRGKEAIGALDHIPVRSAAQVILEGSEEAFRRRYERYGF